MVDENANELNAREIELEEKTEPDIPAAGDAEQEPWFANYGRTAKLNNSLKLVVK